MACFLRAVRRLCSRLFSSQSSHANHLHRLNHSMLPSVYHPPRVTPLTSSTASSTPSSSSLLAASPPLSIVSVNVLAPIYKAVHLKPPHGHAAESQGGQGHEQKQQGGQTPPGQTHQTHPGHTSNGGPRVYESELEAQWQSRMAALARMLAQLDASVIWFGRILRLAFA